MKTFYLKTKDGETINRASFYLKMDAIEYFSDIKKMSDKDLLSVFIVTSKK
jgi:hypothetical protein